MVCLVLVITGQLGIEVLKTHEVKTACMEEFWTLFNMKNFVLHLYPSLTLQEVEISKEHEVGEKWWVITTFLSQEDF